MSLVLAFGHPLEQPLGSQAYALDGIMSQTKKDA